MLDHHSFCLIGLCEDIVFPANHRDVGSLHLMAAPVILSVNNELFRNALKQKMPDAVPKKSTVNIMDFLQRSLWEVVWPTEILKRLLHESAPRHLIYLNSLLEMQPHVALWLPFRVKRIKYVKVAS